MIRVIFIKNGENNSQFKDSVESKDSSNLENLKKLFTDDIYIQQEAISSNNDVFEILQSVEDSTSHVLIIRENSISHLSVDNMKKKLQAVIDIKNYDLFYLCKWNDEIQKHRTISKEKNPENIRRLYSCEGLHCIMFSPNARMVLTGRKQYRREESCNGKTNECSKFINEKIDSSMKMQDTIQDCMKKGFLIGVTITPNLVNYDVTRIQDNEDFLKLNEIKKIDENYNNKNNKSNVFLNWLAFIILVIVIIIVAYLVIKLGTDKNSPKKDMNITNHKIKV